MTEGKERRGTERWVEEYSEAKIGIVMNIS